MGRELQKKKRRSSIPKIKLKPKSKKVNPRGNAIVASNWNQKETLTQNYKRLGLTSRLNSATGGVEKLRPGLDSKSSTKNKLAISNAIPRTLEPREARVERDPESGKILRVIHTTSPLNPLNDPLNSDLEDAEDVEDDMDDSHASFSGSNTIIKQLEEQASMEAEKKPRQQSVREREWIERLVARHGEDYEAMARDMRLNPMQQTSNDIKRRIAKWRKDMPGQVDLA